MYIMHVADDYNGVMPSVRNMPNCLNRFRIALGG